MQAKHECELVWEAMQTEVQRLLAELLDAPALTAQHGPAGSSGTTCAAPSFCCVPLAVIDWPHYYPITMAPDGMGPFYAKLWMMTRAPMCSASDSFPA